MNYTEVSDLTEANTPTVELDSLANWVELYAETQARIKALQERAAAARERIEAALGDAETGTVAGTPVVRWAHVTSVRLDQGRAKRALQALGVLDQCQVTATSRRFTLVEAE